MNNLRTSVEYERLMIGVFVICGLGCASAVLVVLAVAGLLLAAIWWAQRWLREYQEDRADIAHVNAVLTARALAEQSQTDDLLIGGQR